MAVTSLLQTLIALSGYNVGDEKIICCARVDEVVTFALVNLSPATIHLNSPVQ